MQTELYYQKNRKKGLKKEKIYSIINRLARRVKHSNGNVSVPDKATD